MLSPEFPSQQDQSPLQPTDIVDAIHAAHVRPVSPDTVGAGMPANVEAREQTAAERALGVIPGTTAEEFEQGIGIKHVPVGNPLTSAERGQQMLGVKPGATIEDYMKS